jgi:hypothetical protein
MNPMIFDARMLVPKRQSGWKQFLKLLTYVMDEEVWHEHTTLEKDPRAIASNQSVHS